ncbi:MAG: hypothetical protein AAFV53_22075 [Myxococcota bacterium]
MAVNEPDPRGPLRAIGRQLRAVLITAHIFAVFILAFPAPSGGMNRSAWSDPTVQAEFVSWSARLQAMGLESSPESLEETLWSWAQSYMQRRRDLLKPFMPYYRYCGTYQTWRMFIAPHRNPARLHIDIYEDGEWRPVYIARHPQHDWKGELLDHERMRSAIFRYAWKHYGRSYKHFGEWIAAEAAEEFPEATLIRLRYERFRTPTPEQVREENRPPSTFVHPRTFQLETFR